MPGLDALLLGYVLYRSRLVPRFIPAVGLVGAPLFLASAIATILGFNEQVSVWSGIVVIPIFVWELSLGLWLTFRGFSPSAAAALGAGSDELASQVPPQNVVAPKSAGA